MFVLSKIFWLVLNPGNVVTFILFLGSVLLFTRFRRTGRWLVSGACVFLIVVGTIPFGAWLIENLENRFPANPSIPAEIDGVIVLGGTINQFITAARQQPSLSDGAERLTELVYLARRFPDAKLIFSGGSGALVDRGLSEADAARLFYDRMGLTGDRIQYEDESRNTYENAILSQVIAGDSAKSGRWVLVTSALHMPRAMGVFRRTGWNVLAYPVDYLSDGSGRFTLGFNPLVGLGHLNKALREWTGLLAYRILGRTSAIVPSAKVAADN
tara:strand:- start:2345 stop:3154 length:810 start_codon:yes stop_codon:yes gene_type:complete